MTPRVFFDLGKRETVTAQHSPYCGVWLWSVRHATPAGMLKL